ncbi:hypothetical protein ABPG72_013676 [Tetrahymena utriculariae]
MGDDIVRKFQNVCLKNKLNHMSFDKCKAIVNHIFSEEGESSIDFLDSGSFGLVLKYENPRQLKKGAVKVIIGNIYYENSIKEVKDEIEIQININNPYIAKVKGFTKVILDKTFIIGFIWMQYYEDGSLKRFLDKFREQKQELDLKTKIKLGIQLFDALASMHQKNVFHRDIKAANILMYQRDCAIADFGVSRIQNIEQQISNSINTKGTPIFLDPEIHSGKLDKKMDLFAMGIVLLMMDNVIKFAYESHVETDMIDNYGYYNSSFAQNKIIQELREKLNTNTIFFKIAEKLITTKIRQRPTAAECLDLLKEEESRLNLFATQVYSTKKYGQSRVIENYDESVLNEYGDEGAYSNSVREQNIKSSISSISSIYDFQNESEVLMKGQKVDQKINYNGSSSSSRNNSNNNNIQNIQQQQATNNFFVNKQGKTFNNQVNNFMEGLQTVNKPLDTKKKSAQIGGFSDHIDKFDNNSYDISSERNQIRDDNSQMNISSDQSSSINSSLNVQNVPAFQKFYIKKEQILFYEGTFEEFQQRIKAKKTDYDKVNGISFKLKLSENQTIQEHLMARKLDQLFIHIQKYFEAIKEPIYYFDLNLNSIQNINEDCIELIQNFLSNPIMSKIKFLYLNLKGDQESEGFKKIVKPLSDRKEIEQLDLQLFSFTKIKDSNIKMLTQACEQMNNLVSFKINLQDNSTLKDSSFEYFSKMFLKLSQLEDVQLVFWNNARFSDYALQQLQFGKKLQHLDIRVGNCSNMSDRGIAQLCDNLKNVEKLISFKLFSTNTTQFTDSALMQICKHLKIVQTLKIFNLQFNFAENITDEGLKNISELIQDPKKEFSQIVLNFNSSKCFTARGIDPLINSFSKQKKLTKLKLNFNECAYLEGVHLIAISNSLEQMQHLTSFQLDFNQCRVTFGLDSLFRAFSSTKELKKLKIFLNKSHLTAEFQKLLIESVSKLQLEYLALQMINNNRDLYQELKSCEAIKRIKNFNI